MTQNSFRRILSLVALVLFAVPVWGVSWEGNVTITYNSVTEAYPFRIPDISRPVRGALVNNAHDWAGGQCDWYNNAQMRTLADTYNLVQFEWWGRFNSKAETVAVAEKILLVLKQAAADRAKPEIEFTFVAITGLSGCAEDASWIADAPNLRPRMLAVVCYHDENTPAPDGVPMLGVCAGKEWSSNGPILQLQGHKDLMGGWAKNGQPATVSVEPGQDHPYMADNQSFVAQWLDSLVRLRLPATPPSNNAAAVLPSWKNNRAYIGFFDSSTDAAAPWNGGYRAINLSTQTYASYTGTATWIWLPDQIVANAWMTYMGTGSWVYTPGSGDQVTPAITTQPTNRSVTVGQTATFSVVATGTPTPTYVWRKNGGAISGATSASFTTPATVIGDNGAVFSVVVSNSAGAVTSSNATLTVTTTAVAPTTFTPAPGTFSSAQTVTIGCGTAGATIHYTTDGSTPTALSAVYSAAIVVASTMTIQAIATATGLTNSSVTSATYTITIVPPPPGTVETPTFTPTPGTYSAAQSVTVACSTAGATIHYTTDGSTPTASSAIYGGAIPVASTSTIQAIATATGLTNSSVASATYTITIVPPPPAPVATPTFTPTPGTYSAAQSVTIACSTAGATIHYTTDGSTPTASSAIYGGAIPVASTSTIQAIATATGLTNSSVASATYTITIVPPPPGTVETPTFTPTPGTYSAAQSVTIACSTAGAAIHYTTDGSTPTASSAIYGGAIPVASTSTIQAIATATGLTNSSVASATYTITIVPPPPATVATPTFTPTPGTYSSAQSVAIVCSTAGATIHYTTDGSTPTASSAVYGGAIPVASTTTIQAIATATGMTNSSVASATYTVTIAPPPATVAMPTFSPAPSTSSSAQAVTIACDTAGATIYYTTDGSIPTAFSPVYIGAITVISTTTIQAIATAPGMVTSAVATATFEIIPETAGTSSHPFAAPMDHNGGGCGAGNMISLIFLTAMMGLRYRKARVSAV